MRAMLLLVLTLILAYANEWAPYYVYLLQNNNLKILGSIDQWEEKCTDDNILNSTCSKQYRVPLKEYSFSREQVIGLGMIISATEICCRSTADCSMYFGDKMNPGATLDQLTTYQVVSGKNLQCTDEIIVKAWSPVSYRRNGYIGSPSVIGDKPSVDRVKKIIDFFIILLPIILTITLILICISNFLTQKLIDIPDSEMPFREYYLFWIGFSFVSTGLAQILFPFITNDFLFTRISNFCSMVAHFSPGIWAIARTRAMPSFIINMAQLLTKKIKSTTVIQPIYLLIAILCLSPFFGVAFGPIMLICGMLFLLNSLFVKDFIMLSYAFVIILESLKFFNLQLMPLGKLPLIYVVLTIINSFFQRIKSGANLISTLLWTKKIVNTLECSTESLLEEFSARFKINHITLMIGEKSGGCKIIIYKNSIGQTWNKNIFYKSSIPAVFAHVLATRDPLVHIDEESDFANNLKKSRKNLTYNGRYFSVYPMLHPNSIPTVISFTDYSDDLVKDKILNLSLDMAVSVLFPYLSNKIHNDINLQKEESLVIYSDAIRKLKEYVMDLSRNDSIVLQEVAEIISNSIGANVILYKLNIFSKELKIEAISGYSNEIKVEYRKVNFFAVSHNQHGPIPLAIYKRKVIVIPDINWLSGVLHPITNEIFAKAKTENCAVVPLFDDSDIQDFKVPDHKIWGVLWVDSNVYDKFTFMHELGLQSLGFEVNAIISKLKLKNLQIRTENALAGFVPSHIVSALINNECIRENEVGLLLMADLKGSSAIAYKYGANTLRQFVKDITPLVESIAFKYKFKLQVVVWDGFYFTLCTDSPSSYLDELKNFSEELNELFSQAVAHVFPEFKSNNGISARFCMTYGDITRDIQENVINQWTIVGSSMAGVSKLEQSCKEISGWLYATSTVFESKAKKDWVAAQKTIQSTGEDILVYIKLPQRAVLNQDMIKLLNQIRAEYIKEVA